MFVVKSLCILYVLGRCGAIFIGKNANLNLASSFGTNGHKTSYANTGTPYSAQRVRQNADCHRVGQFLRDVTDKCRYLVCDYGPEPWRDEYGNIQLYSRSVLCPPGTSVPANYQGSTNQYHAILPCLIFDKQCIPKQSVQTSYGNAGGYGNGAINNYANTGTHVSTGSYGNFGNNNGFGGNRGFGNVGGYGSQVISGGYPVNTNSFKSNGYGNSLGVSVTSGYGNNANNGYGNNGNRGFNLNFGNKGNFVGEIIGQNSGYGSSSRQPVIYLQNNGYQGNSGFGSNRGNGFKLYLGNNNNNNNRSPNKPGTLSLSFFRGQKNYT